jgi:hypothetical protein
MQYHTEGRRRAIALNKRYALRQAPLSRPTLSRLIGMPQIPVKSLVKLKKGYKQLLQRWTAASNMCAYV